MQHLSSEQCTKRYPRLTRAMKYAAILTETEAGCALRDLRSVCAGALPPDYLRHGGGEAVSHFGGLLEVVKAAIRCRSITRIDMTRLRAMAKACGWTWFRGGAAVWEYTVYDADGNEIGRTEHHEWAAWHRALAAEGRTEIKRNSDYQQTSAILRSR